MELQETTIPTVGVGGPAHTYTLRPAQLAADVQASRHLACKTIMLWSHQVAELAAAPGGPVTALAAHLNTPQQHALQLQLLRDWQDPIRQQDSAAKPEPRHYMLQMLQLP